MTFNPNTNPTNPISIDTGNTGRSSSQAFLTVFQSRDPGPTDVNYPVQQRWVDTVNNAEWILLGYSNSTGVLQANWYELGTGAVSTENLTGNSGGPVSPSSNNIFVVGDTTTVNIVGDNSTHTLTVSTAGSVATSYVENSGSAIPSGGVLTVVGSAGVTTTGAGSTITITPDGTIPIVFDENSGSAMAVAGVLHVIGTSGITTVGSGNMITIEPTGIIATTYQEDGPTTAQPSGNILKVIGGTGIATSGSGNTITITNTNPGSALTFLEDVGSATPSAGDITFTGAVGIHTSGTGSTVTISGTAAVPLQFTTNSGMAVPSGNNLNILGVQESPHLERVAQ